MIHAYGSLKCDTRKVYLCRARDSEYMCWVDFRINRDFWGYVYLHFCRLSTCVHSQGSSNSENVHKTPSSSGDGKPRKICYRNWKRKFREESGKRSAIYHSEVSLIPTSSWPVLWLRFDYHNIWPHGIFVILYFSNVLFIYKDTLTIRLSKCLVQMPCFKKNDKVCFLDIYHIWGYAYKQYLFK